MIISSSLPPSWPHDHHNLHCQCCHRNRCDHRHHRRRLIEQRMRRIDSHDVFHDHYNFDFQCCHHHHHDLCDHCHHHYWLTGRMRRIDSHEFKPRQRGDHYAATTLSPLGQEGPSNIWDILGFWVIFDFGKRQRYFISTTTRPLCSHHSARRDVLIFGILEIC